MSPAIRVRVLVVVEAYVGSRAGDFGWFWVLGLSDGVLDEAGCGGFVDCKLACTGIVDKQISLL